MGMGIYPQAYVYPEAQSEVATAITDGSASTVVLPTRTSTSGRRGHLASAEELSLDF